MSLQYLRAELSWDEQPQSSASREEGVGGLVGGKEIRESKFLVERMQHTYSKLNAQDGFVTTSDLRSQLRFDVSLKTARRYLQLLERYGLAVCERDYLNGQRLLWQAQ